MQSSQSINWLATLAPSLITSFFLVITQILVAGWLSRRTERYKRDLSKEIEDHKKVISKELEGYKVQLQADFQTEFYEFQTRYSLLHQKRAEAIETLFGLLAKVQNDLQILAAWENLSRTETRAEFYAKSQKDFEALIDFFDQKRIYFDSVVSGRVRALVGVVRQLLTGQESIEALRQSAPEYAHSMQQTAINILNDTVHPLMNRLEEQFRTLLSAVNRS